MGVAKYDDVRWWRKGGNLGERGLLLYLSGCIGSHDLAYRDCNPRWVLSQKYEKVARPAELRLRKIPAKQRSQEAARTCDDIAVARPGTRNGASRAALRTGSDDEGTRAV